MDPALVHDLSQRFQRLMEEKRNHPRAGPSNARTSAAASSSQPAPSGFQQLPFTSHPWYRQIQSLSQVPQRYLAPGLQDKVLETLDLGAIYAFADEFSSSNPELGYQDCVIKGLLQYFKHTFFKWVTSPVCSRCGGETEGRGQQQPSAEESRKGAGRTEIYSCKTTPAHAPTRFPRYDDPATLLDWRQGRCGEWANCFTLCCLALGSRARWVWNAEDHVWTEVWSEHLGRWVHCDSCEEAFDQPQVYAVGWGKKMSYVLAFSSEGACDVTRRYVRKAEQGLPRNKAPEEVTRKAVEDVNSRCRTGRGDEEVRRLKEEDEAEERELAGYVTAPTATAPEEERPRESGSTEWKEARGEMGRK